MTNKTISFLIAQFHTYRDVYFSTSYNETQLRHDFLNKVIDVLGWDVNNKQGVHAAYQEVVHEDHIIIDGHLKTPDYCIQRKC